MPTRRIDNVPAGRCPDPEHDPPKNQVFEDGLYEHTCPACGNVQFFTVTSPSW